MFCKRIGRLSAIISNYRRQHWQREMTKKPDSRTLVEREKFSFVWERLENVILIIAVIIEFYAWKWSDY